MLESMRSILELLRGLPVDGFYWEGRDTKGSLCLFYSDAFSGLYWISSKRLIARERS